MKVSDIKCHKCGQDAMEASSRGAYLERISPKGESFIGECRPSCKHNQGTQGDAFIRAIEGCEGDVLVKAIEDD